MVDYDVRNGDGPATTPLAKAEAVHLAGDLPAGDVTHILSAIEQGDGQAAAELLPLVYQELRKLAAAKMAQEPPGHSLQATALVHDAYLRLVDGKQAQHWNSRGHFFMAAAEAMRRILIENARQKGREKHGGSRQRISLEGLELAGPASTWTHTDLLALDEALSRLAECEPVKARLVRLRFFAGLGNQQAAEILGISAATAKRYWRYARAWLHAALESADESL